MEHTIILDHVTKQYKKCIAVNDVTTRITGPMIYGLIGKNGAGKTTLLKMIGGIASPTSGSVTVGTKKTVGVLIENPGLFTHLDARDNLLVKMKMTGSGDEDEAERLLSKVGLAGVGKKKAGAFSLGMKQRLGIALALIGDPDLILLDEPVNGLDPEGIVFIRDFLKELRSEGKTIIVSSHLLGELSKVSDRYGFLDNGRLIKEFDATELNHAESSVFSLSVDRIAPAFDLLLSNGYRVSLEDNLILIRESEQRASQALSAVLSEGVVVKEFKKYEVGLEEFFLSGGASNDR
ncbi:MAG: ATP-binding cassette domain-containing protein [Clostridia bacterium]|nr:ATP-binding cassette domain-containing protein [Clostridia bacterium]